MKTDFKKEIFWLFGLDQFSGILFALIQVYSKLF